MNPTPSPALAALRSATAPLHQSLERAMHLSSPGAGREQYAAFVAALWGWLAPIERTIWAGPWPAGAAPAERSVKVRWLEEDIDTARVDGFLPGAIAARGIEERFDSLACCAGWAYVIEGSMLGAQVLERRLAPALGPWPARWLQGYGDEGARRWREFLEVVDASITTPADIEACTRGGVRAFDTIGRWMREQGAA